MKQILIQTLIAVFFCPIFGNSDITELETMINRVKSLSKLPSGTAVAVVKNDEIIYEGYFGYADIEAGKKVEPDTVFYIASATKPFFALSSLILEHQGQIHLDQSMSDLFPNFKFPQIDANAIRAQNLLTHTSGIENVPLVMATAYTGLHDLDQRVRLIQESQPDLKSKPGHFSYTNVGYNILSVWYDLNLKQAWQDVVFQTIFKPAGMTHTSARMSDAKKNNWMVAKPYSFGNANKQKELYLQKQDKTMHSAGGMVSTARDLARFLIAELNRGRIEGRQVFPPGVIKASQQKKAETNSHFGGFKRDGYAWGWYTGDYKGERMLHHFGGFAGTHAHLSFIPKQKIGLVVLNNEDLASSRLTELIADWVYIQLLNGNAEESIQKSITSITQFLEKVNHKLEERHAKMAARTWQLGLETVDYVGNFSNPVMGNVNIKCDPGGDLSVNWGVLKAKATPFPRADSLRVELVPGSGEVIQFLIKDNQVQSLTLEGYTFKKVPNL